MITGLMLLAAYILPLIIMGACFYYDLFASKDLLSRLTTIGIASVIPSAIIMIFVVKRILQLVFTVLCIAGVLFTLYHFGLIGATP